MEITLSFTSDMTRTVRENKGKSLIEFPQNFCVVDLETTGLNPNFDEIIEVSALKIRNNSIVDKYTSLAKITDGCNLDDFIVKLTGITDEMLNTAPALDEVLKKFLDFVGDDIIVGYNVNFDINFIYDNCNECLNNTFKNNFIDVLRIARKLLPSLRNHKLSTIADYYGIDCTNAHRALNDCIITLECFNALKNEAINQFGNEKNFISKFNKIHFKKTPSTVKASDIVTNNTEFDITHPFYNKVCVFTGALEKLSRREAMQIVADFGGICADGVTKKTNYLILGNNDYCKNIKDGKSNKQKRAEELKLKGNDIEVITENTFYDIVEDNI